MTMRWDKMGAQALIRSGVLTAVESNEAKRDNLLRVLAYHRIGQPDPGGALGDPSLFSVTAEGFAEQMAYLAEHYHVIAPPDLLDALAGRRRLPPRSVMITFDDGYHDFMDLAWPVLERLGLPALLFVPTDYLCGGRAFWWDRLYHAFFQSQCGELQLPPFGVWSWRTCEEREAALKAVKRHIKRMEHHEAMAHVDKVVRALGVEFDPEGVMLTWPELRQMADRGLYVGPHTLSHPILSRISREEARGEITGSAAAVAHELAQRWPIFCYPVGHPADLRSHLPETLRQEHFQAAFTMLEGHNVIGRADPFGLRRVGIAPHLSLDEFRLVLTQAYNIYGMLVRAELS